MSDALLALKAAQFSRANEMLPVMEAAFLAVSMLLGLFVAQKRRESGVPVVPSRLALLGGSAFVFGGAAFFLRFWGIGHGLYALAFTLGMLLSLADPVAAVGFLLANVLMRPWEMADVGEMAFIPKTLFALTLSSWVFHEARARRLGILINLPSRLFYALVAWFLLSALLAGDFLEGLGKFSGTVLIALIVFLVVSNVPRTDRDLQVLKKVLVLSITGLIAHATLVTTLQPGFSPSLYRLEDAGTVGNTNDLAALITIALPLALTPLFRSSAGSSAGARGTLGARLLAWGCGFVLVAGLLVSQSRGAMLALVVAVAGYRVIFSANRRKAIGWVLVGIPLLVAFSQALNFARREDDLRGSTASRLAFMVAGINMGIRHPILGVGHDNFAYMWDAYSIGETPEGGARSGHSSWLVAFAENGFPGLLLLIALFVQTFKKALQAHRQYPELVVVLLGYGVAMTFLAHVYTIYPYLVFAMILAAARIQASSTFNHPEGIRP